MRPSDALLVLTSVALSALSQIMLKKGMMHPLVQAAINGANPTDIAMAIARSVMVWSGLLCFGLSAIVWMFVLSRIPLSQAYPFVALGITVTVTAGALLFGEAVSWPALVGIALIIGGVVLVGVRA